MRTDSCGSLLISINIAKAVYIDEDNYNSKHFIRSKTVIYIKNIHIITIYIFIRMKNYRYNEFLLSQ
jgi:hypothetical protein